MNSKKLKDTKTEANLQAAFAGESMARNKYDYYASRAKKDGYEQIAMFFSETANNEKEHAKIWFKLLHDGIPPTEVNLQDGIDGENYEHTEMYAQFEREAREEGFNDIADLFKGVAHIEFTHEQRYKRLLESVKNKTVFSRPVAITWVCRNCAHPHIGKTPPSICPVCVHPQSFFEQVQENY
ncbi:MAG: rubrerythrin family protein [Firmicutes bacterium]|nr:rubrerythrin family protein [Bacillota bacterium]